MILRHTSESTSRASLAPTAFAWRQVQSRRVDLAPLRARDEKHSCSPLRAEAKPAPLAASVVSCSDHQAQKKAAILR